MCTLQKSSTPANREKCTRFYLLFEHLRVWFRFCNLVTIVGHMFGIIPTVVVLVILLPNVTVPFAIGMLMAVWMYIHFPNTFVWAVWESTVNGATGYTNCIQLETISYCTDVMVGFHHFLFKVVWSNRIDKLAHSSLCCVVLTKGYSQYQSDSDLSALPYQVATCTQQTFILDII